MCCPLLTLTPFGIILYRETNESLMSAFMGINFSADIPLTTAPGRAATFFNPSKYGSFKNKGTVMENSTPTKTSNAPWNKGKLVGQKPPFKLKEIWAIRIRLELANNLRDLALFNLAIDSKLRGCGSSVFGYSTLPPATKFCHEQWFFKVRPNCLFNLRLRNRPVYRSLLEFLTRDSPPPSSCFRATGVIRPI